jgi:ABC-type multidrug transport system fused ATPase/permease subunit
MSSRSSTVRKADKIIVIDKGEVTESGTHEELLLFKNGIYRSLSSLQIEVMG